MLFRSRYFDLSFDEVIYYRYWGKTLARIYKKTTIDTSQEKSRESIILENNYDSIKTERQEDLNEKARLQFATDYEYKLLDEAGMDTKVTTRGENNKELVIEYVLMGRALAHQWIKDKNFYMSIKKLGFTTVMFKDGYNFNVYYSIE